MLQLADKCSACKHPGRWRSESFEVWFAPRLRGCPHKLATPGGIALINAHTAHQDLGALPYPGDLSDQPQWLLEAFDVIRRAVSDTLELWKGRQNTEVRRAELAARKAG